MGKKSRLKKERRELKGHGLVEKSFNIFLQFNEKKRSIYRFFKNACEADALVSGKVWITTLEECRKCEDPNRGDSKEAHEFYNSGHAYGNSDDPRLVEIAKRSGIYFSEDFISRDITISNNTKVIYISNAYVLCTTKEYSSEKLSGMFGKFCVEITDPKQFFVSVSKCLGKEVSIKEAVAGEVIYKDRNYTGLEQPPGPIGFVKPPDNYASQKEFRFLWIPIEPEQIKPFLLECSSTIGLCKRIA